MKRILVLIAFIFPAMLFAQSVAINIDASPPDNNAILDIKSSTKGLLIPRLTTLQRTSIAGPSIGLTVYDIETFNYWVYRGDVNGGWVEFLSHLDKHWNRTGTDVFNMNPGNIGIGTNNPTEKLTINATDPAIRFLNSNTEKGYLQVVGNNLKLGTYGSNNTGNLVFNIRGTDRMTIAADGNFGIGISAPVGKFQIASGYESSLSSHGFLMLGTESGANLIMDNNEIMARNNGAASHLYLQNEGGNVTIGDPTLFNSSHKLGVEGNMVITGGLRIGTTVSPGGYKLAVDGKVICTELLVRLVPSWPDYVFSKNYLLKGLDEVEEFIKINNHLPGIPSAKTLEANGMNIGEMQKLQMEKIEELTLYIIELKKEMEKLSAGSCGKVHK
jgi:hypothetical protein